MTKAEYELEKKKKYQEYKAGLITNYAYIQWKKKNDPSLNGGAASTSTIKSTATTMQDPGQEAADQAVGELEKRLRKTYKQAKDEITKKLAEWSKEYAAKDAEMQAKVASGEITQDEYQSWQQGQALAGKLWRQKLDQVSGVLLEANQQAMEIINKQKMGVFAENANFQSYQLTQDTKMDLSFAVYDVDAVAKLIKDQPELLPRKQVNGKKDKAWNQTKMANIAAQAIIQGESIPQIARRISTETASDNMKAMVRYARTAMTSAQNAGRMETLHRAKGMGIQCKKVWLATLDRRTRDSHRNLDGQVRDIDEPFDSDFGKIMFPGDPEGHPGDVYNCRCTLTYQYEDYPVDPSTNDRLMYEEWDEEVPVKKKDKNGKEYETKKIIHHRESKLVTDMTYHEWETWKQGGGIQPTGVRPVTGKDLTGIWGRRPDKFKTEIEDIINAQGFDNNPQVVSQEEFEEAVRKSGIIAQRAYRAKDQETLDKYTDELYHGGPGNWYVDSGIGGDSYGQGMYSAYSMSGKITDEMKSAMEMYGKQNNGSVSKIETFTLTPDAKIITLEDLYKMEDVEKYRDQLEIYKSKRTGEESIDNITSLAALKGYDAVIVDGEGEMIVLNRSKCIFLADEAESRLQQKIDQAIETSRVAQGTDITGTWKRREGKFKTEIEDVINTQGFDGIPRLASKEDFEEAAKKSNLIMQRAYTAPDQATLNRYRDMLYRGEWYVDCSTGGAALGKGMYAVYENGTTVTEYMAKEMRGYSGKQKFAYVETFTLTSDAKIITTKEIAKERAELNQRIMKGIQERGGYGNKEALEWASQVGDCLKYDDGTFAALLGYDAIVTKDEVDNYAVVLNRTKCIFRYER